MKKNNNGKIIYTEFSSAVKRRDRKTLLKILDSEIVNSTGHFDYAIDWYKNLDEDFSNCFENLFAL